MKKSDTQGFDLSSFSVLVAGCGGLGCNAAVHLAGGGIGRLYLCDFDTVNESNLNRQFLYTPGDVGKMKADTAARRLKGYAPETELIPIKNKIGKGFSPPTHLDAIICAVDNSATRDYLEGLAEREGIPLIIGGVDGFYGMAYLYLPGKSQKTSLSGVFEGRDAALSVSSTCGIIGAAQSALTIRYLLTRDEKLSGKLLIYDEYKFDTLTLKG